MSVWLTPDLKPIFGGTYFPPNECYYNRHGLKGLLLQIAEMVLYREGRTEIALSQGLLFSDSFGTVVQTIV